MIFAAPSPCPDPNRCQFTGCAGNCEPPRQAAAVPNLSRHPAQVALGKIASVRRNSEAPFRPRDAHAHRKLLLAALS